MAQEYILINNDKENGMITLSKGVFDSIMQISIEDEENAFPAEGSGLRKTSNCKIINNELIVHVDVRLKYGANVNETCESLQQRIDSAIYQMTNLHCGQIDIHVVGFVF